MKRHKNVISETRKNDVGVLEIKTSQELGNCPKWAKKGLIERAAALHICSLGYLVTNLVMNLVIP